MAKRVIEINPTIYATEFLFRESMIWKGMTAAGSHTVKDPIAYLNRMEKKFGAIVKEAAALAYEHLPHNCLAVCESKIDEALSAKYGWKTCREWRAEGFERLRKDMGEV